MTAIKKRCVLLTSVTLGYCAAAAGNAFAGGGYGFGSHFSPYMLIRPMGILTFCCMVSTLLLGIFMPKNRKKFFPWHKRLAYLTITSAVLHGALVMIF
jgi:preprotein translocase subunit SecG